ncbi:MAG: lysine--tRNA ligase [Thermodesulfobacteriota bacterium]
MNEKLNDQTEIRIDKLHQLVEQGINPFSNNFKPKDVVKDLINTYGDKSRDELSEINKQFVVAGRITSKRDFGKSIFFHLKDRTGKIQGFIQRDTVGADNLKFFKKFVDVGDFIGLTGNLFKTKTEELTVNVNEYTFLTKSLRPLPEKWHGLQDVELRYRQRYLDLISNEQVKDIFLKRNRIVKLIKNYLDEREFIEVETPILHTIAGGAAAKPFVTHHNALDMDLFLRIAPELYLKRLVVGGLERVYELGRTFRNEGISTKHNPEFTMVEFYQAYATYEDLMSLIEEMISGICREICGQEIIVYQDKEINFKTPWKRININDALSEKYGKELLENENEIFKKAKSLGIEHNNIKGKAIAEIFELEIGEKLVHPTFVYAFPLDVSPLARKNDKNSDITDRFELYINGWEIANAFSELNDPVDQKERFKKQLENKAKGDEESHENDDDFITALEYGMPPTAGAGIGIDRLVMLLTNSSSIREVIFFPHLKP